MSSIGRFRLVAAVAGMVVLDAFGATYYASPKGSDGADCLRPDSAGSLTRALALAAESATPSGWGDAIEVRLLDGTYLTSSIEPVTIGDAPTAFALTKDYVRIVSDSGVREDVVILGNGEEGPEMRGFYLEGKIVLAGLTVTNFYLSGTTYSSGRDGGGVYCYSGADEMISNCVIACNTACRGGGARAGVHYGNLYQGNRAQSSSSSTASGGGAIFAQKMLRTIVDCTFRGNASPYYAIFSDRYNTVSVSGCVFEGHESTSDMMFLQTGYFTNCTFRANRSTASIFKLQSGGTVFNSWFVCNTSSVCVAEGASAEMTLCHFLTNSCTGTSINSGIAKSGTIRKAYFCGNVSSSQSCLCISPSWLYDCVVTNNSAGMLLGQHQNNTTHSIGASNCTFVCNTGVGLRGRGYLTSCVWAKNENEHPSYPFLQGYDGSYLHNSLLVENSSTSAKQPLVSIGSIVNSTLVDNTVKAGYAIVGGATAIDNSVVYGSNAYHFSGDAITARNCLVPTGQLTPTADDSTLTLVSPVRTDDPRFAAKNSRAPWGGAFRRKSPAIDNGSDALAPPVSADLAGASRVAGLHVDIGCYEYQPKIGLMLLLR